MNRIRLIVALFALILSQFNVSAQIITTVAGIPGSLGYSGDWGAATAGKMRYPAEVVADNAGNIYISEATNYVVRKVNSSGIITTIAGTGTAGYSGDGGAAIDAEIRPTAGMAIDKQGNIYISQRDDYVIRRIDATSGLITHFAGNGSSTASGDGGPATAAGLGAPLGICFDTAGNLYVSANFYIRKINTAGIISTIAGTGINGNSGDDGSAVTAKLGGAPYLVADISGDIYFANAGIGDGTIRKISTSGIITRIAGTIAGGYSGDFGPATLAQFNNPKDVFVDSCGNVYITDVGNFVVRVISAATGNVYSIIGNGTQGYTGDGGPASAAQLNGGGAITMDKNNNLYITDALSATVRKVQMPSCADIVFPVSLGEVTAKEKSSIDIYPNPNDGAFILKVSTGGSAPVHVALVTMVGATVQEYIVQPGKETTLKPYLPLGIYMVVAVSENGRLMKKVVVR